MSNHKWYGGEGGGVEGGQNEGYNTDNTIQYNTKYYFPHDPSTYMFSIQMYVRSILFCFTCDKFIFSKPPSVECTNILIIVNNIVNCNCK